jgi:pyruvate dehydrogenase E2 component (dihydrolipoamide acetyltransferase)
MHHLHLPRLGQTMERGLIQQWLVPLGQPFVVGDPLYVVETEKVNVEVEAKLPGTIARVMVPEGAEVPTGALLAIVADPGEVVSEVDVEAAIAADRDPVPASAPGADEPDRSTPAATTGTRTTRIRAMPRARALAMEKGIDLSTVRGSAPDGAITVEDVERAAVRADRADVAPRVRTRYRPSAIARTMAGVVSRSWREIPQFVQNVTVDAGALMECRARDGPALAAACGLSLSYSVLLVEALVKAVAAAPEVNASLLGDEIVVYEDVNVSVATASPLGLMVPVLRRAQACSRVDLARRLQELAERARAGALHPEDVEGGTITLSNLGMYGVESGTPLVTAPQAAVVFAGAIADQPAVVNGLVAVRPLLRLAVACDHRILDGVAAARFTTALKSFLESCPQAAEGPT